MNGCALPAGFDVTTVKETVNRWIVTEANRTLTAVNEAIASYRFADAAASVYRFIWNTYCDWYVELIKPLLAGDDGAAKDETRATAAFIRDFILKILHPFMPLVTEELWDRTAPEWAPRQTLLAHAPWPEALGEDAAAAAEMNWVVDAVTQIRSVRSEMNVPPAAQVPLYLVAESDEIVLRLERHKSALVRLARLGEVHTASVPPKGMVQVVVGETAACLDLSGIVDLGEERTRLKREIEKATKEIERFDAKLRNDQFVQRAPIEVIEEQREKRDAAQTLRDRLSAALERLSA
jgi:valyl-tRNA synthetase